MQDRCAMKVCTDACIFGAAVATKVSRNYKQPLNILDIGTGTGLLSLMMAQQLDATIDAVEMNDAAHEQAAGNFQQSIWKDRLHAHHTNVLQFDPGKKYDCIISNPPFFEGDLRSGDPQKNAAKHDTGLTLEELLSVVSSHIAEDGIFAVLLPYHRVTFFIQLALKAGFYLQEQLFIRHTHTHPFFRGILFFSRKNIITATRELAIKNATGNYTPEMIALLKDYYLYL